MKFTPKSEEEIQIGNLLEKGDYEFLVVNAEDTESKKGNAMIKLTIIVYGTDGREHMIFDYLLESMEFKLRHFCAATGMLDLYEKGSFQASDCINRTGRCRVIIKHDKTGEYPPKNQIADYHLAEAKADGAKKNNDFDDDVPF